MTKLNILYADHRCCRGGAGYYSEGEPPERTGHSSSWTLQAEGNN